MTDERKFCFIICTNNEDYLEECFFYISHLEIPEGYFVDVVSILEAESMAGAYNEAMRTSDARYKIYLHQDVFILYKGFLQAVLDIFQSDSAIGMIGMVGTPKMSAGGVMWFGRREGMLYGVNDIKADYQTYQYCIRDGLYEVEAIDGLLMITCADILWREDKFDGWDFYDVSQSFEFRKKGLKVVVPEQLCPWCKHDSGVLNLMNFDKYRKICMAEYPEYFSRERFCVVKKKNISGNRRIRAVIIARNQRNGVKSILESIRAFSDLTTDQIIIVDNASEDGLRHWLNAQQNMDYMICNGVMEGYGIILNKIMEHFLCGEDLLILTPGIMLLPECLEKLVFALEEAETGAVCARQILKGESAGKTFLDAAQYAMECGSMQEKMNVSKLPYEAVLIKNELLKKTAGFDAGLFSPEDVMMDFSVRGQKSGYHYYEIQNSFVYRIADSEQAYISGEKQL